MAGGLVGGASPRGLLRRDVVRLIGRDLSDRGFDPDSVSLPRGRARFRRVGRGVTMQVLGYPAVRLTVPSPEPQLLSGSLPGSARPGGSCGLWYVGDRGSWRGFAGWRTGQLSLTA